MADELKDEWTLELRKPVRLGKGVEETVYTEIELREPVLEEVLGFSSRAARGSGEAMKWLIAKISGVPLAVLDKITIRDFNAAVDYLTAFMAPEEKPAGDEEDPIAGN